MKVCPQCGKQFSGKEQYCSRDGTPLSDPQKAAAPVVQPKDALTGRLVSGRYRVVAPLGAGAMGEVYLGRHEALKRQVAIKILRPEMADEGRTIQRFLLEARAACQLDHPNIVSIFDFGQDDDGRYFLVMEYVEGRSLREIGKEQGTFDQHRVVHLLEQLLAALEVAHGAGIVHRDLKPANIICTSRFDDPEFVKLLDFGLAKILSDELISDTLTRAGCVVGTPSYMSPEQAVGKEIDHRSDLYTVGLMAYQLLCGYLPFYGKNMRELVYHHVSSPPRPLHTYPTIEVHPDLELLVHTLLAKKPEERFQSAGAGLKVLQSIVETIKAEPEGEDVLSRTRTVLGSCTMLADPVQSPGRTMAPDDRTAFGQPLTTVWHASNLIDELRRLGKLWARRVAETAELLWGGDSLPEEVSAALETIEKVEEGISERETAIALLKAEISQEAESFRRLAAVRRSARAELVAQLGAVRVSLRATGGSSDDMKQAAVEVAATLLPGQEVTDDSIGDVQKLHVLEAGVDGKIEELDRESRRMAREHVQLVTQHERAMVPMIDEVQNLEKRLGPLYARVAARAGDAAEGKPDLRPYLTALTEVAGAIQICQRRLSTIKK